MAKHELHQFDLINAAARRFVETCDVQRDEEIFEVGPGLGALTALFLEQGARVHAVEADSERVQLLRQRFADDIAAGGLQLLLGDARQMLPLFHGAYRIIANPPFQHSAAFMRQWILEDLPAGPPQRIDLVLQKQSIAKYVASEQEQTRSSVLFKLWGQPRQSLILQREDVEPVSHVDLACFSMTRHAQAATPQQLRAVDKVLALGFAGAHSVREALKKITTNQILKRQAKMHRWDPDMHPRAP